MHDDHHVDEPIFGNQLFEEQNKSGYNIANLNNSLQKPCKEFIGL